MPTVTIEVTETEYKAMEYAAADVTEWADNALTNRCRIAIDEIVQLYTTRALDEGVAIPVSRDLIVADAFARGWVQRAADVTPEELPE